MPEVHGGDLRVGGQHEDVLDVSFSTPQWFFAWCGISMIEPFNDFDDGDCVAIDIAYYDGDPNNRTPQIAGGKFGDPGAFSNYHTPVVKRFGEGVRFRLRSFDSKGCHAAGYGLIFSLI